jgi:transposase
MGTVRFFEVGVMLKPESPSATFTELDHVVFNLIVPDDHYLRAVSQVIDFELFRPRFTDSYSLTMGRPPIDPICMLKILFLRYQYKLTSDRSVLGRMQTDMAFRWFLGFGMKDHLPHHTDCTNFRKRIGVDKFEAIFQDLIGLARERGLLKDRLRLKDATHMFAAIADVKPLSLAAQVRDSLLHAAKPFFPDWVAQQQALIETLRQTTAEFADEERLAARLEYLQEMATQLQALAAPLPSPTPKTSTHRVRLDRALAVAAKLFADHADPEAGDRLGSALDPDARRGWHHQFFVGYLLDIAIDADSEIITAVNVLAGNGAEADDAVTLIQQEETAQGNDVQGISMDGVGCKGPVLRELTDPNGLNLDVTVPPVEKSDSKTFGPERFALTVINDGVSEVTCPNGQTTRQRERNTNDTGYRYIFKPKQCAGCPLREQCLQNPHSKGGRKVIKNDYEAEYRKVEAKAKTPEYKETRRVHPKIERKLGELARHHGARHAHYRGRQKVLRQAFLTAMVVNVKRMVKLLVNVLPNPATANTLPVRAEVVAV